MVYVSPIINSNFNISEIMKRKDLIVEVQRVGINSESLFFELLTFVVHKEGPEETLDCVALKQQMKTFVSRLREKYKKYNRKFDRLISNENDWLDKNLEIIRVQEPTKAGPGRPKKEWNETADRTKRLRVSMLASEEPEPLALAAIKSAKQANKTDLASSLKKCVNNDTENTKAVPKMMSPEEALALKVQCNLSNDAYQMIRNSACEHNANIFPSLHNILKVKYESYPDNLTITETSAECSLQDMVNHTLSRIMSISSENSSLSKLLHDGGGDTIFGEFFMKAGFDGASSQSIYKQKYENTDLQSATYHEESLFQTAIVPLKLNIGDQNVWLNKKPNSSHFCRPLKIQYKRESKELSKEEFSRLKSELDNIEPFHVSLVTENNNQLNIQIKIRVDFTMFDGKVINAITDTNSTQSCNICGAKPSEMNKIEVIRNKEVNNQACELGLSSLHCWLR